MAQQRAASSSSPVRRRLASSARHVACSPPTAVPTRWRRWSQGQLANRDASQIGTAQNAERSQRMREEELARQQAAMGLREAERRLRVAELEVRKLQFLLQRAERQLEQASAKKARQAEVLEEETCRARVRQEELKHSLEARLAEVGEARGCVLRAELAARSLGAGTPLLAAVGAVMTPLEAPPEAAAAETQLELARLAGENRELRERLYQLEEEVTLQFAKQAAAQKLEESVSVADAASLSTSSTYAPASRTGHNIYFPIVRATSAVSSFSSFASSGCSMSPCGSYVSPCGSSAYAGSCPGTCLVSPTTAIAGTGSHAPTWNAAPAAQTALIGSLSHLSKRPTQLCNAVWTGLCTSPASTPSVMAPPSSAIPATSTSSQLRMYAVQVMPPTDPKPRSAFQSTRSKWSGMEDNRTAAKPACGGC